jgi:hypothetical protein
MTARARTSRGRVGRLAYHGDPNLTRLEVQIVRSVQRIA